MRRGMSTMFQVIGLLMNVLNEREQVDESVKKTVMLLEECNHRVVNEDGAVYIAPSEMNVVVCLDEGQCQT